MKIHLAYGKNGLDVVVPDGNLLKVLTMEGAEPLPDPHAALVTSLEHPIESVSLRQRARGVRNACIVICDITRPVPNKIVLPPLLSLLEQEGISGDKITILVATGLHRPSSDAELDHLVGKEIIQRYRVVDHHARVVAEHRNKGTTKRGTPVWIDARYCDADLKITAGFIEPHLMAGFSGGRKMIAPGCAGEETIKALHSPQFLEDPRCSEGNIDDNPLHHELLEIAGMTGHDFMVDVALDEGGRITGVFAGHPQRAHEAGVKHVRKAVRSTLDKAADIVITTAAGFPLDLTYYQAIKGMTAALPIVKPGGTLILAAECAEGLGSREFTGMATTFSSAGEFRERILSNPVIIDQWQLEECAKAATHAEVILVAGGIKPAERKRLFISTAESVEEALERGLRKQGKNAAVAVIPKGPYTLVGIGQ